jgi:predicted metal-dependent peptidase
MDIVTHTDTAERRLKRVKINLMRDDRFAFWRGIMMVGKTEVIDDFPTAYTDGYNEGYGRAFIESQNDKQVAFAVLHENLHKIGRDLTLWGKMFKDDAQLANMACDYRHNLLLMDMDPVGLTIEMPTNPDGSRMGLLDERFRDMDPPTIFRILKQEKKDGTGAFGPNGDGTKVQGNFDEHDWEASDKRTDEQKETQAKEVDQALRQGEMEHRKANGSKAGNMERFLSDMLKPKINWKDALADFWRSNCVGRDDNTWRTPNRRFVGMDILLPSTFSQRVGRGVIGADMSGSVGQRETTLIVGEIAYLASQVHPEQIDLLYWDSAVARHETYDETNMDTLATSTKPRGGGGTNPHCVKQYIADHDMEPEFVIMLTDGYVSSWPDFDCPVLWVITTKNITAPTGVSIYLEDNGND